MKAFEKWRDRQEKEGIAQGCRHGNRVTWRAVLKWVRIKAENYTPEDILYFIDEELRED